MSELSWHDRGKGDIKAEPDRQGPLAGATVRSNVWHLVDEEYCRYPATDRQREQYQLATDNAALQPGSARHRQYAESDRHRDLAQTD